MTASDSDLVPMYNHPRHQGENTKETNPKDRAATTRLDLSLFPATARAYGALAMTEGDLKYGGYNYRTAGVKASAYYAACNRHLDKWFNGEWCDPDTKVPHLASALACIGVLIDAKECDKLNDDRPPRCDMGGLLGQSESRVKHLQEMFPGGPPRHTAKQTSTHNINTLVDEDGFWAFIREQASKRGCIPTPERRVGPKDRRQTFFPYWIGGSVGTDKKTGQRRLGRNTAIPGRRSTDGK